MDTDGRGARLRDYTAAMTQAGAARDQSRLFLLAAQRCNEFRPLPSGTLQFLFIPSLVCYAFSIEVGLKALALHVVGAAPYRHDLDHLLRILPQDLQEQIVADTGHASDFDSDLALVRDVFDVWRYVYEEAPALRDTDLGFLQRFAAAVQKALTIVP